jgi:hypothetical protein
VVGKTRAAEELTVLTWNEQELSEIKNETLRLNEAARLIIVARVIFPSGDSAEHCQATSSNWRLQVTKYCLPLMKRI